MFKPPRPQIFLTSSSYLCSIFVHRFVGWRSMLSRALPFSYNSLCKSISPSPHYIFSSFLNAATYLYELSSSMCSPFTWNSAWRVSLCLLHKHWSRSGNALVKRSASSWTHPFSRGPYNYPLHATGILRRRGVALGPATRGGAPSCTTTAIYIFQTNWQMWEQSQVSLILTTIMLRSTRFYSPYYAPKAVHKEISLFFFQVMKW